MDAKLLRAWVDRLCADDLDGRAAGSPAARAFVREAFGAGVRVVEQRVPASRGTNVLGMLGDGPPYVVVGAHFDHLGGAYRGADDNAAAVAVLLELARRPAPARGTLVLAAFDAEEPPHFLTEGMGSVEFVRRAPVPLAEVRVAVVMDLVGHALAGPEAVAESLFVLGAEKTAGLPEVVSEAHAMAHPPGGGGGSLQLRHVGLDFLPPLSDYAAFREAGVPPLFLTCGRWRHYHTPGDTPDKLDYAKLARIGDFVDALARRALDTPPPRYDDDARDHAGTAASLLAFARDLGDARAVRALEPLATAAARRALDASEFATLLQWLVMLEQRVA